MPPILSRISAIGLDLSIKSSYLFAKRISLAFDKSTGIIFVKFPYSSGLVNHFSNPSEERTRLPYRSLDNQIGCSASMGSLRELGAIRNDMNLIIL